MTILQGDVIEQLQTLPDRSVHCVVTSPPYWGLRDYGVEGQLGLEKTPEEYTQKMVNVFREVKRVLRDDGTLWLNLGDSYASSPVGKFNGGSEVFHGRDLTGHSQSATIDKFKASGLKQKDMVGIPWRIAFALQADGWYLRSDIIWSKPNPMPESVTDRPTKAHEYVFLLSKKSKYYYDADAVREPLQECSVERAKYGWNGTMVFDEKGKETYRSQPDPVEKMGERWSPTSGRNRRTVWEIATQPTPEAHFATFPEALVEPCIKSGTSERGCCPICGAPWERIVEKGESLDEQKKSCGADSEGGYNGISQKHKNLMYDGQLPQTMHLNRVLKQDQTGNPTYTGFNARYKQQNASDVKRRILDGMKERISSWQPACKCGELLSVVPCVVLDPFGGSGTTGLVARNLKRDCILIELNPEYVKIMKKKLRLNEQLSEE